MHDPGPGNIDRDAVARAYKAWAPLYDRTQGPVLAGGRRAAARTAAQSHRHILEVGVGTGLSFADYPARCAVVGMDLSPSMLAQARRRLAGGRSPNVKGLVLGDVHQLPFADDTFDCVVASFLITLVASPEAMLSECLRVINTRGEIILVNHFYSEVGVRAKIERWLSEPARKIGLHPDFEYGRIESWAKASGAIGPVEKIKVRGLGAYTVVRLPRR